MTTNIERTAEVIGEWIDNNLPHSEQNFGAGEGIAQALAQNDLLIPHAHIPGPSYCVQEFGDIYLGQSLEWEDYGISIVFGKRVGGDRGPELFVPEQDFSSSESVKEYVAYLLEAAKEMEKMEATDV